LADLQRVKYANFSDFTHIASISISIPITPVEHRVIVGRILKSDNFLPNQCSHFPLMQFLDATIVSSMLIFHHIVYNLSVQYG